MELEEAKEILIKDYEGWSTKDLIEKIIELLNDHSTADAMITMAEIILEEEDETDYGV